MEATGAYSLPLADFLVNQGYFVSMVNPAKIHSFAKSELSRAKTDKADAKLIARYALAMQPPLWIPPPANIRELQALVRRVEHLLEMIQMEKNRLDTANASVKSSISTVIATLEAELKATREAIQNQINSDPDLKKRGDLLDSITGVGAATVAHLLIVLSPHHDKPMQNKWLPLQDLRLRRVNRGNGAAIPILPKMAIPFYAKLCTCRLW
jgi:transposase